MTVNQARLMGIIIKEGLQNMQDVSRKIALNTQGQMLLTNDYEVEK